MFYMAVEEKEDGKLSIPIDNNSDKNLIALLNKRIVSLQEENAELKRRLKKYAKEKIMEQDFIYNRAAGQERGE